MRAADRRAQNRHVAGVVENPFFLLVGGVMLFIDDDQPEVLIGQKERGPRPDDKLRLPLPDHAPDPPAFGHRGAGVPLCGPRAEALLDPTHELRRQGDLGQQDQRLPPFAERRRHGLEVDLGLARARHTAQQGGAIAFRPDSRRKALCCRCLIRRQVFAGPGGVEPRKRQITRAVLFHDGALRHQTLHHRGSHPGHLGEFFQGKG